MLLSLEFIHQVDGTANVATRLTRGGRLQQGRHAHELDQQAVGDSVLSGFSIVKHQTAQRLAVKDNADTKLGSFGVTGFDIFNQLLR
jgi:hypothetical protein